MDILKVDNNNLTLFDIPEIAYKLILDTDINIFINLLQTNSIFSNVLSKKDIDNILHNSLIYKNRNWTIYNKHDHNLIICKLPNGNVYMKVYTYPKLGLISIIDINTTNNLFVSYDFTYNIHFAHHSFTCIRHLVQSISYNKRIHTNDILNMSDKNVCAIGKKYYNYYMSLVT